MLQGSGDPLPPLDGAEVVEQPPGAEDDVQSGGHPEKQLVAGAPAKRQISYLSPGVCSDSAP